MKSIFKLIGALMLGIIIQANAQQTSNQLNKLSGQMELSAYPVHKSSLLGLTSTEYPTVGIGFSGSYRRWSFYAISFHEASDESLYLSQFEENVSCKVLSRENISCTIFNTSVSTTKNSALYMIPTLAISFGHEKNFKFDLTPYTWGFNTNVSGYTYTFSYNYSKSIRMKLSAEVQTKAVYTHVDPLYKGPIAEFSPSVKWKSYKIQVRTIYQFSGQHFIYDLSLRKVLSFSQL